MQIKSYRSVRSALPASRYRVIPRSEATWESPGTMSDAAKQVGRLYQEIATGLTALAMTVVAFA